MKCVQCLFLASQAKGHGPVPLLCLSQGQRQMPGGEIQFCPLATFEMLPYRLKVCLDSMSL